MMIWKHLRNLILATTCGGTLWVLAQLLLPAPSTQSQVKSSGLPIAVPLPGWQALDSLPLDNPMGKTYRYQQGKRQLTIEMRYVVQHYPNESVFRRYDPSRADSSQLKPIIRKQDEIGYYSLSMDKDKAYLRSCINPRGEGAITSEQFIRNRYTADLTPERFILWLMGQEELRDYRCLWAHLSVPLNGTAPDKAYQILEKTWPIWYQWWHPQFSKL